MNPQMKTGKFSKRSKIDQNDGFYSEKILDKGKVRKNCYHFPIQRPLNPQISKS